MRLWNGVRLVHLWVGLTLSVLLLVLAVTGAALTYKEAYWRLAYPELRKPDPVVSAEDRAGAIRASHELFGDALGSVKMPEPGVPAYHLYLAEGEAFVSVGEHALIDRWSPRERLMPLLFDIHAHLMAGEAGERVGGVIGFMGAFLVLSGLVLWWPARRSFELRNAFPHGWTRGRLVSWHRDLGTLSTPLLMILLLTGGGIVFYEQAGVILNGLFGDPYQEAPEPTGRTDVSFALADAAMIERVDALMPGARMVFYYPPAGGSGVHGFRLKQPCELHPNGRSFVYLDHKGRLLQKTDACTLPPGQVALHAIYPLHAGKAGSQVYKLLVFLGGIALAVLSATGALAYMRKLRWI